MFDLKKIPLSFKIIIAVFVIDIVLVAFHFLLGQSILIFNLDYERNIPTFYQGFKLVSVGCVVFSQIVVDFISGYKNKKISWNMVPLVFLFIFLALDEVGQLHENSQEIVHMISPNLASIYADFFMGMGYKSAPWVIIYFPAFLVFLLYLVFLIRYFYKRRVRSVSYFFLGIASFAFVILFEIIGTYEKVFHQPPFYTYIVAIEEYFEMLGATFFLAFHLTWLRDSIIEKAQRQNRSILI